MPFSGNGKKELPGEEKVSPFAEHSTRSGKTGAETQDGKTGRVCCFRFSSLLARSLFSILHLFWRALFLFSVYPFSFFHCENWKGEK